MEVTFRNHEILQSSQKARDSFRMTGGGFVNAAFLVWIQNDESDDAAVKFLPELRSAVQAELIDYIETYNRDRAKPFTWTYDGKTA